MMEAHVGAFRTVLQWRPSGIVVGAKNATNIGHMNVGRVVTRIGDE